MGDDCDGKPANRRAPAARAFSRAAPGARTEHPKGGLPRTRQSVRRPARKAARSSAASPQRAPLVVASAPGLHSPDPAGAMSLEGVLGFLQRSRSLSSDSEGSSSARASESDESVKVRGAPKGLSAGSARGEAQRRGRLAGPTPHPSAKADSRGYPAARP